MNSWCLKLIILQVMQIRAVVLAMVNTKISRTKLLLLHKNLVDFDHTLKLLEGTFDTCIRRTKCMGNYLLPIKILISHCTKGKYRMFFWVGKQKKRPLLLQLQILLYNVGTSLIAFHAVYMAVLTFSVSCYSRFFPSNQSDLFKESGHCETGLLTPVIKQIQHHLWKADTDVKPIFFSNHA